MSADNFNDVWKSVINNEVAVLDTDISLQHTIRANHVDK